MNNDEEIQMEWLRNHHIVDKDAEAALAAQAEAEKMAKPKTGFRGKKPQGRNPSSWEYPNPEDEIDLHGMTSDEAAEAVERRIDELLIAGLSVLRVIHGGGNPEYGNVKHIIDRKVRSEWKNRIIFYKVEVENAGSSIMKIGKPRPVAPKKKK